MQDSTFILFIIILFSGCDIINPSEEIPSYISVSSVEIEDNPEIDEGSLTSHKMVAGNLVINLDGYGIINVPGEIPTLLEGEVDMTFDPIVVENGAADLFVIYPFFERVVFTTELSKEKKDTVSLKTRYINNANYIIGSFNGNNTFFTDDLDGDPLTTIELTSEGAMPTQGNIGKIVLGEDHTSFEAATQLNNNINNFVGVARAFLEVQYKTENPITFGLKNVDLDVGGLIYEYGINTKEEWNTIYFDLLPLIRESGIINFQIIVRSNLPSNYEGPDVEILLDNIKVIYL